MVLSLKKFEKNLKEIPLQMTMKIQQCRWGRGGGSRIGPAIYISKALFYLSEKKVHTSRDFSISTLS